MLRITDEVVDNIQEYYNNMAKMRLSGQGGCILYLPCRKCGRIHTDSICLCGGAFVCLNCGHQNGLKLYLYEVNND